MKNHNKNSKKRIIDNAIIFYDKYDKNIIETNIPGTPFAKQRPRATKKGRFVTIYTPPETKSYEKRVRDRYYDQNGYRMLDGPLEAEIIGTFPVSDSISKKRKKLMLEGKILHTKKPDCDNMAKIALDALNGIAYKDDAQIIKLIIEKKYGENPELNIKIKRREN